MPTLLLLWVWLCAYLNCAGWGLSALHQLRLGGYALALFLGLVALLAWRANSSKCILPRVSLQQLHRRFRRLLPAAFLGLAVVAIAGGVFHAPNNLDELTYRFPRILHWLAEGHWHWIHTPDARMNDRASGFEWLTAPLFALTRSDRLFFLPNAVSFLFLPGLIYSVFIRLGIARKVAWHWMWLLPAGFNYALQAGSVANDAFGAVFALAAMDGALRFGESRRQSDLWLSILAAGLMTGAKTSNLPLLLPWCGAMLFAFRAGIRMSAALVVVGLASLLSSCLPNAVLNVQHGSDWTGSDLENPRQRIHNPLVGIAGNLAAWGLANIQLPIMPWSHATGDKLAHHLVPQTFLNFYDDNFEGHFVHTWSSGIQTEEGSGLGVAICCLWFGSAFAPLFCRRRFGTGGGSAGEKPFCNRQIFLLVLPWIALLAYMANAGMGPVGRLLSAYYPLLIPLLLVSPAQEWIVRQRWWRWGAVMAFLMAGVLVILTPARPLFPYEQLLPNHGKNAFLDRARVSYIQNARRGDALSPVRAFIPSDISAVGFVSRGNEIEPSLWRPFGQRHVIYIIPGDTAADLRRLGVEYVVLGSETLEASNQSIGDWLKDYGAEQAGQVTITNTYPTYVPYDWYVARLCP